MSDSPLPVDGNRSDWPRMVAQRVNHLLSKTSEIVLSAEGIPTAGQRLLRFKSQRPMKLIATGSLGDASVAATASAVFTIKINSAAAGTITFAAGATTATVAITTPNVPTLGLLEVFAPSPSDATLSAITIALAVAR